MLRLIALLGSFLAASGALADPPAAEPDEIQFRSLTPDDFRAAHPPSEAVGHPMGFHAISCLRIGWPAGLRAEFSERQDSGGQRRVSASITQPSFVALFDRSCSWWSPELADHGYALTHEQVHFAISEHAARALSKEMRIERVAVRGYGDSPKAALANLEQNLERTASRARREARREHDAFDAETRRDRSPEVQEKWVRAYEERLGIRLACE
jgi:hypothetical protein